MTTPHLTPVRTVAPGSPLLTLAEAKAHLREEATDQDALISALIDAVTSHLDGWSGVLGRALVTQTWRFDFPGFDTDELALGLAPVQSVTITYVDADGATQTLAADQYYLIADAMGAKIVPSASATWPSTQARPDAVKVTAVCGYGTPAQVPQAIKTAALMLIGGMYAQREAVITGTTVAANPLVASLLAPFRRVCL